MRETVLIVNENANARIIAEALLQARGIAARSAEDATEAVEALDRDASVGVLLLDLDEMSPGRSGWELLRQLRRLSRPPRVVVQSERREAETETFARRLGAEAFLRKPTAPEELLDTIGGMLQPQLRLEIRRRATR